MSLLLVNVFTKQRVGTEFKHSVCDLSCYQCAGPSQCWWTTAHTHVHNLLSEPFNIIYCRLKVMMVPVNTLIIHNLLLYFRAMKRVNMQYYTEIAWRYQQCLTSSIFRAFCLIRVLSVNHAERARRPCVHIPPASNPPRAHRTRADIDPRGASDMTLSRQEVDRSWRQNMSTLNIQQSHERFLHLLSSLKLSDGFHTSVHPLPRPQFIRPVTWTDALHQHVLRIQTFFHMACTFPAFSRASMFTAIVQQLQKSWWGVLREMIEEKNHKCNVFSISTAFPHVNNGK